MGEGSACPGGATQGWLSPGNWGCVGTHMCHVPSARESCDPGMLSIKGFGV